MTSIVVKNNIALTNKVVNTKMQKIKKEYRLALLLERHLYNEIRSIEAVLKKLSITRHIELCAYWAFGLLTGMVKERIEIAQKASSYEVAEGEIQSVYVKEHYTHYYYKGSHDSLDRKYVGVITYTDKNGEAKQLTSSEVDKKLKAGKRIKVACHTTDPTDADSACFDIWVFSYIPCYLKSYNGIDVILFVATVFGTLAFGWLVWLFIVIAVYGEYE